MYVALFQKLEGLRHLNVQGSGFDFHFLHCKVVSKSYSMKSWTQLFNSQGPICVFPMLNCKPNQRKMAIFRQFQSHKMLEFVQICQKFILYVHGQQQKTLKMLNCPTQSKTATEIRILRGKMPFYYRIREKYHEIRVLQQFFIEMNSLAFLESFAILHGPIK